MRRTLLATALVLASANAALADTPATPEVIVDPPAVDTVGSLAPYWVIETMSLIFVVGVGLTLNAIGS